MAEGMQPHNSAASLHGLLFVVAPTAEDDELQEEDLADVLESLMKAKDKAYVLGLKLGLQPYEVRSICDNNAKPEDRLTRILEMFLKEAGHVPTWRVIINALRSDLVNLPRLAKEIEDAHFPNPTSTRDVDTNDGKTTPVADPGGFLLGFLCLQLKPQNFVRLYKYSGALIAHAFWVWLSSARMRIRNLDPPLIYTYYEVLLYSTPL